MQPVDLKYLLYPESVAVAGASASPDKFGHRVLFNIINKGFEGRVYPVNPREKDVLGLESFPSVSDIPAEVDLAVITVPTAGVKSVIEDCIRKGVRAAIVITSGFSEVGAEGAAMESEIADLARSAGLALVGPNCVGMISTNSSLYCHMMPVYPFKGSIAVVAQSGSVADIISLQLCDRGMGISHLISAGNEAVLRIGDYLDYLAADDRVSVILSYVEGIRDGRRFMEAVKNVTAKKPMIMLKAGSSAAGARAARSHTAALAGSDEVIDSLLRQAGVIRADSIEEMADMACAFSKQPKPAGNRVGVIAPGGGWGVIAADVCSRLGLEVPQLDRATLGKLDAILPPIWSHNNPVDTVAGVKGEAEDMVRALLESPVLDGLMVLGVVGGVQPMWKYIKTGMGSKSMTEGFTRGAIERFERYYRDMNVLKERYGKPVLVSLILPVNVDVITGTATRLTRETGTACYTSFTQASRAYSALNKYAGYLRKIAPRS
jgi:acetyl-CoA synthetase (ADP-forming)/acetyltransferase